jgi:hypothetical protein
MKRIILISISLIVAFFLVVSAISKYRSVDEDYACVGQIGKNTKVYSLHYDRFFSGILWSKWGWAHVTLQSDWYDFAGAYYFDQHGNLDEEIMKIDKSVFFYQDKDTIHASTGLDTPRMKQVDFNLKTKVLVFQDREKNIVFEGVCSL